MFLLAICGRIHLFKFMYIYGKCKGISVTCYQVGLIMAVKPKRVTIRHKLLSASIGCYLKVDDMEHYCSDHMYTGKSN